ncbi:MULTISPECIES: hypothetical protein [unclassified Rhizobium]|uniref:hypothetical protein n=1 Tax=unclassified Rhizobium TaxID=2613769 RepID=UPI000B530B1A
MPKAVPKTPDDPAPVPVRPGKTTDEPQVNPVRDPSDKKKPNDPPRDPALLPIGDPAGAA